MVNSQNGWPAKPDTSTFVRFLAGGRGWWAANQDVAIVFKDFIDWFNREIEPIASADPILDDWSWANRLVRGSTTVVSNHGSATAFDINATRHPRGRRNTFSKALAKKIREKLKEYDGVIRWGGDYTTTVDDMHFEINSNWEHTKHVADKISERDMFTIQDKAWLSAEIRKQVIEVLTDERLVPNKPLKEGDPQGADWTVSDVLAAGDLKADRANADLKKILTNTTTKS